MKARKWKRNVPLTSINRLAKLTMPRCLPMVGDPANMPRRETQQGERALYQQAIDAKRAAAVP